MRQQKFQPEVEGFLKGVEDGFFFFFFQTIGELSGRKAGDILYSSSKEKKQEYKLFEGGNHVFNIVVFEVSPVTLEVFSDAH